jgi:3-oxoacyl-[acyl-carrier-protein] synthase-3
MKILATGKYLPKKILTNADLEKIVETSDEWITTRTGIKERRIAEGTEDSSFMGAQAARDALATSGISTDDIDLIVTATVTPPATFPSTSCYIQNLIGAPHAAAFDIQAACSGFIYGLVVADQFIRSGASTYALVIGSERLSSIIDWKDRATSVLFGDGAGAAVLKRREDGKSGLLGFDLGANGALHEILHLKNPSCCGVNGSGTLDRQYMRMEGQDVFKQAVTEMCHSANKSLERAGLAMDDIKCVIPHQANIRIIDALGKRLKAPPEKVFVNVERYGNISAACVPVALCEAAPAYNFQPGDKILLVAFGGGLTWASAVLEW